MIKLTEEEIASITFYMSMAVNKYYVDVYRVKGKEEEAKMYIKDRNIFRALLERDKESKCINCKHYMDPIPIDDEYYRCVGLKVHSGNDPWVYVKNDKETFSCPNWEKKECQDTKKNQSLEKQPPS